MAAWNKDPLAITGKQAESEAFKVLYANGAPGTIRTSDPQIRSLMLYPAELRARFSRLTGVRSENPARKVKAADTPAGLAKAI